MVRYTMSIGKQLFLANVLWTVGSLALPKVGDDQGWVMTRLGHGRPLGPGFYQGLFLFNELLPVLSMFWFVAMILELGHFAA